eukprot:evm.model.scf_2832.1 EVM.evm.TU.scf_2832.1   scf_2832:304-2977(-)
MSLARGSPAVVRLAPRLPPRPACNPNLRTPGIRTWPPASDADRRSLRAGAAAVEEVAPSGRPEPIPVEAFRLACPICTDTEFELVPGSRERPACGRCGREFDVAGDFVDLTLTSGAGRMVYQAPQWAGTRTFRSPLVSLAYERGWRQSFSSAGFPGPDREFEMAMEFLAPVVGGIVMDLSCGSGLFTRRFANEGAFAGVMAVDFSESMLRQARQYLRREAGERGAPVLLVRADVGRLPVATGSLDAIHAAAAIHCWPDPPNAFAEISRALAPGGIFVASTFLDTFSPLGQIFGDENVRPLKRLARRTNNLYRAWEEQELRDLTAS